MEKMSELKRDLAKANEIIVRLSTENDKYRAERQTFQQELNKNREKVRRTLFERRKCSICLQMKTKDQIATKQERLLQEKERELASLQKENAELTQKLEKANDSFQKLTEQHNEAKELLKKNEALINYLNHKLTESQNHQPSHGRLLNGNLTLDSSSSTTANTNQFRPTSFLVTSSRLNGFAQFTEFLSESFSKQWNRISFGSTCCTISNFTNTL